MTITTSELLELMAEEMGKLRADLDRILEAAGCPLDGAEDEDPVDWLVERLRQMPRPLPGAAANGAAHGL